MAPRSTITRRWLRCGRTLAVVVGLVVAALAGCLAAVVVWPDLGGQGADRLRDWLGDQPVAQLENIVFGVQDAANGWMARLGWVHPAAPWVVPPTNLATARHPLAARAAPTLVVPRPRAASPAAPANSAVPAENGTWPPAPLPAIGTLTGVGVWTPYLHEPSGTIVAYRTFLQPDPHRPYAIAAIVAFDTRHTSFHLVLGSDEPRSPVVIARPGTIPAGDIRPGVLLAAFNGGFKARHGHFGVMVDGVTVLPPRPGFGTVALYEDGRVRIGAWGTDIVAQKDILAWRQNGPLVIQNGQINPHTADITSQDWGIILNGVTAVWRSGLAISADGRILYYVAGTSLTLPTLARTLATTGAASALQLDINTTMVHFDTFSATPRGWASMPLLAVMKPQHDDRYLTGSTRDYFYVTAVDH